MAQGAARDVNAGEFVHAFWTSRTFYVTGTRLYGTGVLLDEKRVYTAAHLGFVLNHSYEIKNLDAGALMAKCLYISKQFDFAVLVCEQLPEQNVVQAMPDKGRDYFILGFPRLAKNESPLITKGVFENIHTDNIHFIGDSGARRGYSGGPVVTSGNGFYGILLGVIESIDSTSTFEEAFRLFGEHKSVKILPYLVILSVSAAASSDQES